MSVPSLEELERQLSALPREAWDRPAPPPPPWAAGAPAARPERRPSTDRPTTSTNGHGPGASGPSERRSREPGASGPSERRSRRRGFPLSGLRPRPSLVLRPLAAAALSLVLLATGIGAGLLIGGGDGADPGGSGAEDVTVRLDPVGSGGTGAAGVVTISGGAGGHAQVRLSGLDPSARGDFYELWLLGRRGELVSLGSVRVPRSGRAELRVPLPVDPGRFRFLDVSREPADGDPGHSADSVLRGPAA